MWAWDKSKAVVRNSVLQADSTYVVLTHGEAHADVQVRGHEVKAANPLRGSVRAVWWHCNINYLQSAIFCKVSGILSHC